MILSCRYQTALKLLDDDAYQEAEEIFLSLGDYRDAVDMVSSCRYENASELLKKESYQEAYALFEALGDYKDSAEKSVSCATELARSYADGGKLSEAVALLAEHYDDPQARQLFFELFAEEATDVYLAKTQEAMDSWDEYVLIWLKAVKAVAEKTPVGATVDIPKVDQSAPQVIAIQRSMEKANKSAEKLRQAYNEEVLAACDEDMRNLVDTFFTATETIDNQFQNLDSWAVSLLFYGIKDNNAAKANTKLMNALYDVQDMLEIVTENNG